MTEEQGHQPIQMYRSRSRRLLLVPNRPPNADIWQRFWQLLGEDLPAVLYPLGERLGEALPFLQTQLARPPWTLVHNDYQLDNLFFDESRDEVEIVVADWQLVARGRGPYDVAFFLGGNVKTSDRRAHEETWLADYHRVLVERGVKDYGFEQCLYDYRIALLAILGRHVLVIGSPEVTGDAHACDWSDVVRRYAMAILDHDAGSLLPRSPDLAASS